MSEAASSIPPFVKKFDFRGIYGKDIFDRDAYYLGLALQRVIPLKKVLIGWDTRVSSSLLAEQCMRSFIDTAVEISYLEKCPIDYVTAAAYTFDFDLSIMFTGSHNPWNWTGLLMHLSRGDSIQGEMVEDIIQNYTALRNKPPKNGDLDRAALHDFTNEIEDLFKKKIQAIIPVEEIKPFSILVDIGDGSGEKGLTVLKGLLPQVTFTTLNTRGIYDSSSPHIADPSELKNMQDLMMQMRDVSYDAGFAFDSDADRVLGVDETGAYLNGSLFGSALIESLMHAGSVDRNIGYAVDCGISFHNTVIKLQQSFRDISIQPIPVGRSILRKMVRDGKIDFGIENVGHFYIKDFFMTDSGVFSIALVLYWMSTHGKLSTLFTEYPDGKREQLFVPVSENQDEIMKQLEQKFTELYGKQSLKKIEVDGLRYEMYNGNLIQSWFATRKSGYEPIQKYFFGSLVDNEFEKLRQVVTSIVEVKKS